VSCGGQREGKAEPGLPAQAGQPISLPRYFGDASVPLSSPEIRPRFLCQATVTGQYGVEFSLLKLFKIQQGVVGSCRSAQQLVQLHLHGLRVPVLSRLDEEYHQKRDDARTCIDHELPSIAEPKHWAHEQPGENHARREGEGRVCRWRARLPSQGE